jgi:hypothetical protein
MKKNIVRVTRTIRYTKVSSQTEISSSIPDIGTMLLSFLRRFIGVNSEHNEQLTIGETLSKKAPRNRWELHLLQPDCTLANPGWRWTFSRGAAFWEEKPRRGPVILFDHVTIDTRMCVRRSLRAHSTKENLNTMGTDWNTQVVSGFSF